MFLTLFVRLTKEFTVKEGNNDIKKVEYLWGDIEEVKMEHATRKMKSLPNCVHRYKVSEKVFLELYRASLICPKELYYITPYNKREKN